MYKALLFDVDETLLDFKKGQHQALEKMFADQGVELTPELKAVYQKHNKVLWTAYEDGEIAREEVLGGRFEYIFDYLGMTRDGLAMDKLFRSYLNQEAEFLPGAWEVIQKLKNKYPLYIVTNGVAETQRSRLEKAGLLGEFQEVFISEETGYQKPMPEFFDYVCKRLPNIQREDCLIIGDSLSADIKGGLAAGMATCWLNPAGQENTLGQEPTYQIASISGLLPILKVK